MLRIRDHPAPEFLAVELRDALALKLLALALQLRPCRAQLGPLTLHLGAPRDQFVGCFRILRSLAEQH